jgi:hypothetical protein
MFTNVNWAGTQGMGDKSLLAHASLGSDPQIRGSRGFCGSLEPRVEAVLQPPAGVGLGPPPSATRPQGVGRPVPQARLAVLERIAALSDSGGWPLGWWHWIVGSRSPVG